MIVALSSLFPEKTGSVHIYYAKIRPNSKYTKKTDEKR